MTRKAQATAAPETGTHFAIMKYVDVDGPIVEDVPHNAASVAALQLEAEADVKQALELVRVVDDETYELADAVLTDITRREKAAIAMRGEATGPMYRAARVVEAWFNPLLTALGTIKTHCKGEMNAHLLAKKKREDEAREAAAQAAATGDSDALLTSLTLANEAAERAPGRAAQVFGWKVAQIIEAELPAEYWTPDLVKLDAIAKSIKGDKPPEIPGVRFERTADVRARK